MLNFFIKNSRKILGLGVAVGGSLLATRQIQINKAAAKTAAAKLAKLERSVTLKTGEKIRYKLLSNIMQHLMLLENSQNEDLLKELFKKCKDNEYRVDDGAKFALMDLGLLNASGKPGVYIRAVVLSAVDYKVLVSGDDSVEVLDNPTNIKDFSIYVELNNVSEVPHSLVKNIFYKIYDEGYTDPRDSELVLSFYNTIYKLVQTCQNKDVELDTFTRSVAKDLNLLGENGRRNTDVCNVILSAASSDSKKLLNPTKLRLKY